MALTDEQLQLYRQLKAKQTAPVQAAVAEPVTQTATTTAQPQEQRGFIDRAQDFSTGVVKSLGQTALGIGRMGRNVQNKLGLNVTGSDQSVFDFGSEANTQARQMMEAQNTSEKVGKFVGTAAQFAAPGMAGASKVQGFLARTGTEFATGATIGGLHEAGRDEKFGKEALMEGAIGGAMPVLGSAARFTGRVIKGLAGTLSKSGDDVLELVIQNPDDALKVLKEGQEKGAIELSEKIAKGVKRYSENTSKTYESLKAGASDKTVSLTDDLIASVDDAPVSIREGAETILKEAQDKLEPNELKQFMKAYDKLNDLDGAVTPAKLNETATSINKYTRARTQNNTDLNNQVDRLRRFVRSAAETADDTGSLTAANDYFNERQGLLDVFKDITRINQKQGALRSGEVSKRQLRAVANSLHQFFSERKFIDRAIIEEFEEEAGEKILGKAAAVQLGSPIGEAGGSVGLAVGAAAAPPRTIGRTAARFGQIQKVTNRINEVIPGTLSDDAKAAIQAVIAEEFTFDETNPQSQ